MKKQLKSWAIALAALGPLGSNALAQGDIDEDGCETTEAAIPCSQAECFSGGWEGDEVNECGGAGTTLTDEHHNLLSFTEFGGDYYLTFICTDREGNSTVRHHHGTRGNGIYLGCGPDPQGIGDSVRIICGPTPICATKQP